MKNILVKVVVVVLMMDYVNIVSNIKLKTVLANVIILKSVMELKRIIIVLTVHTRVVIIIVLVIVTNINTLGKKFPQTKKISRTCFGIFYVISVSLTGMTL